MEKFFQSHVKKAFKSQSLLWHPDKNDGDLFCAKRFVKIKEASDLLQETENLKLFNEHDFQFLVSHALKLSSRIKNEVSIALENDQYEEVNKILGIKCHQKF